MQAYVKPKDGIMNLQIINQEPNITQMSHGQTIDALLTRLNWLMVLEEQQWITSDHSPTPLVIEQRLQRLNGIMTMASNHKDALLVEAVYG